MSSPTYDPFGVINLVMQELSRQGIKSRFMGYEIADAKQPAADLLAALGVLPVTPDYSDDDG